MKRMIKQVFGAVVVLVALVVAGQQGFEAFDSLQGPKLVYSEETIAAPMFLGGKNVSYFVKILSFKNVGYRVANAVRVEATVDKSWLQSACTPTQAASKEIVMQRASSGGLLIQGESMLTYGWGDVFDSDLKAIDSIADFRNGEEEGNFILRKDSEDTAFAYKKKLYPGQTGKIQFRTFSAPPFVKKVVFQSDNEIGKLDNAATYRFVMVFYQIGAAICALIVAWWAAPWDWIVPAIPQAAPESAVAASAPANYHPKIVSEVGSRIVKKKKSAIPENLSN